MLKWLQGLIAGSAEQPVGSNSQAETRPAITNAPESTAISPVVRQLVLGREHQVIGYDFALRPAGSRNLPNADELLIRTIHQLGADRIGQFRQLWLTVAEATLPSEWLDELPPKASVILFRPPAHSSVDESLLQAGRSLRGRGFRLALLGQPFTPAGLAWLPIVDYVGLDIGAYAPNELVDVVAELRRHRAQLKLIARRIDSYEEFEYCHDSGFDLFSGHFLTHREVWPPQPPLQPDRTRLYTLLNQLSNGCELNEVADGLRLSPELSYRFLRYVNSAGMGLPNHIASIEQGVVYLGREKLYRWLTLLLFSATGGRPTDTALLEQALMRGRMMELLGSERLTRIQCDELFVVGVFSLLDVLLRLPMDIALGPLQLPVNANQALREASGPYAPYLKLAISAESHDAHDDANEGVANEQVALAKEIGLPMAAVNEHHLCAVAWAQQLDSSPHREA
jgi:c-di-GMP phosphodiesterase